MPIFFIINILILALAAAAFWVLLYLAQYYSRKGQKISAWVNMILLTLGGMLWMYLTMKHPIELGRQMREKVENFVGPAGDFRTLYTFGHNHPWLGDGENMLIIQCTDIVSQKFEMADTSYLNHYPKWPRLSSHWEKSNWLIARPDQDWRGTLHLREKISGFNPEHFIRAKQILLTALQAPGNYYAFAGNERDGDFVFFDQRKGILYLYSFRS